MALSDFNALFTPPPSRAQYVVVDLPSCPPLLLRVLLTNTLTAEEQQDVLGYHCFR